MKFVDARPYAQPEAAARKLAEIAAGIKPIQEADLHRAGQLALPDRVQGQPAEFGADLRYAIEQSWFWMHESGTYLRLLKQED
jgi:hypothetical protein